MIEVYTPEPNGWLCELVDRKKVQASGRGATKEAARERAESNLSKRRQQK